MSGLRRFRSRRRNRPWRRLAVAVALLAVSAVMLMLYCRPVVTSYGENAALRRAERAANEAVSRALEEHAALCRDMIHVTYTDQHMLSSVITDAAAVNTIRTAIGQDVLSRIESLPSLEVAIPVGSLLGPKIFSGWGPVIRFPLSVTATVLSDVTSTLEAVGMNQSAYRVLVNVHVALYVVTPGSRSSVTLDAAYPVAEAVLLGKVPDTLTEVYGDDQTLLGKIFDYGTVE